MTRKSTGEDQQKELSWEEAVARFLEDNPEFFENHPDSLAKLRLAHDVSGKAVSLIERQVHVLREQGLNLQRQLRACQRHLFEVCSPSSFRTECDFFAASAPFLMQPFCRTSLLHLSSDSCQST